MSDQEVKIPHGKRIFLLTLMGAFILGSAVDIFVPSLPYISKSLNADPTMVKLAVMFYLISYGICQFFAGSLSDSFGRKKTILISVFGYMLSSYLITFSVSIHMFLFLRIMQGVFAAGIGVNSRAILSDCFSGKTLSKYASYLLIGWAVGPVIAPFIGGYLQEYFSWHACFYFSVIFSSVVFILMILWLPETHHQRTRFHIKPLLKNYQIVLSNKNFVLGAFICGIAYAFITVYNVIGPFLVQSVLGYNAITYGHIALFLGLSWLMGILLFRFFLAKEKTENLTKYALFLSVFIIVITLIFAVIGHLNLMILVIPFILLFVFGSIVFTDTFASVVKLFPTIGGSASAAMGAMFAIISGGTSGIASSLKTHSIIPMVIFYLVIILIALICFFFIRNRA